MNKQERDDLDKLEALAREALEAPPPTVGLATGFQREFIAAANPSTVLALVARVRALEGLLFDSARDLDTAMDQGDYSNVRDRLFAALHPTKETPDDQG